MNEHRPGQWPVNNPVAVIPTAAEAPRPASVPQPLPEIEVRLTVTVDLTSHYTSALAVTDHLREQTRRNQDCHTAIVRLGPSATANCMGLGQAIAGAFYLSAQRIEVHVPAGHWGGPLIYGEVARHVRLYRAQHQQMQWQTGQASG